MAQKIESSTGVANAIAGSIKSAMNSLEEMDAPASIENDNTAVSSACATTYDKVKTNVKQYSQNGKKAAEGIAKVAAAVNAMDAALSKTPRFGK